MFFENTSTGASSGHHDPTATENVKVTSQRMVDGKVVSETIFVGNVITLIGAQRMRNILGLGMYNETNAYTTFNTTSCIGVSNDPASSANNTVTYLVNEVTTNGFARANATTANLVAWYNGTNYAWNVTKMFTATGTQTLAMAFLAWGLSLQAPNVFAVAAFTSTTFNLNDNVTIVWVITLGTT
jgi:hypothetical protein